MQKLKARQGIYLVKSIELPTQTEKLVDLNPFAVEGRYAVIADDLYDSQLFIDLLREMKGYVAARVGRNALP